jgi:hypothetical protein
MPTACAMWAPPLAVRRESSYIIEPDQAKEIEFQASGADSSIVA